MEVITIEAQAYKELIAHFSKIVEEKFLSCLNQTIHKASNTEKLYDIEEVANILNVTTKTIRTYIYNKKIVAVDFNKETSKRSVYKIKEADLHEFISSKRLC